jgi:thiamine-monophosphate kinase
LSLSLPDGDAAWVDGFLDGFLALAAQHGVNLVGGDTTRGPLSICVTALGLVEPGRAMRREGARVGDEVWVTGTLGDAAAALAQWRAGTGGDAALRERLDRPTPRVAAGLALAGVANACIDVSDGLLADLGHVVRASGVGIEIEIDALPASAELIDGFDGDLRRSLQTAGGDDYELCFCAPRNADAKIAAIADSISMPITRIGRVVAGSGVQAVDGEGKAWSPAAAGYDHFPARA